MELLESRTLLSASLDPTFGSAGLITTDFGGKFDGASSVLQQPDGKLVVAGGSRNPGSTRWSFALARYNSDGSLDSSFGTGGKVTADGGSALAATLQPDGKIVAVGQSNGLHFAVARFNANGSLDTGFGTGGIVTTSFQFIDVPRAVVVQPDGKILVVGSSQFLLMSFPPAVSLAMVRYNADGSLDTSFGTGGKVSPRGPGTANGVTLQPDGKIVVSGATDRFAVFRFNVNGSQDPSFGSNGVAAVDFGTSSMAFDVAQQAGGKLVVAGTAHGTLALTRLNAEGSLDPTFGPTGKVVGDVGDHSDFGAQLVLQPDGKLLVGRQSFPSGVAHEQLTVASYYSDGSLDTRFGSAGQFLANLGSMADVHGLAVQADGRIVVVGGFGNANAGSADFVVARYVAGSDPPSGTPNQRFVTQVYLDLLRRPVDPAGLGFWSSLLDQGQATRAQVVGQIENSLEYRTKVVDSLYSQLLGRDAEPAGLNEAVNFLGAGGTAEQLEASILGSPEYFARNGGTNTSFLAALYRDVLHRTIDPSGAQGWGLLTIGISRTVVAEVILISAESDMNAVQDMYHRYLHHTADLSGLNTYLDALRRGQIPTEQTWTTLLGSEEYFSLTQS